jgi:hypothetical protein|tara:strand:- start:176 stop:1096 length:921 start_codon:yes stop_codon:yes gene_type:complete
MKKLLPFICYICFAQDAYDGTITFDYTGTVNGTFTSMIQDTIPTGFAYNQIGLDTSYFVMGSISENEDESYDLFFAILQDTTFPIQPRTWVIPGQGDQDDPLSLETIVVLMPGLDSSFVVELFDYFSDTTSFGDSLIFDSLLTNLFLEFADDLYLGLAGELEISEVTDSTLTGGFYSTFIKLEFNIPPHMVMTTNGEFEFNKVEIPDLALTEKTAIPESISLFPAYPNPFNPTTTIKFNVDEKSVGHVNLQIFDMKGRIVESVMNGALNPGQHEIQWNATNQPSGVYIAKLQSRTNIQTTKLLLIK